jgi:hypothetical protein
MRTRCTAPVGRAVGEALATGLRAETIEGGLAASRTPSMNSATGSIVGRGRSDDIELSHVPQLA